MAAYTVTVNAGSAPALIRSRARPSTPGALDVVAATGTLNVLRDLTVNAGAFRLDGGTLRGATVSGTGGEFRAVSGVLDNITLRRTLAIEHNTRWTYLPELFVRNGLTLDGGTIALSQPDSGTFYTASSSTVRKRSGGTARSSSRATAARSCASTAAR